MNQQYLSQMLEGLATSLQLTGASLLVGCILSLLMTVTLILRIPAIHWLTRGIITLFTGTPLLVQIFLVYYGPGQFDWIRESFLWTWLSQPWFCAMLALALNTAAYSTLLFRGAFNAIPAGQWEACRALGMDKIATLKVLLPYALRRARSSLLERSDSSLQRHVTGKHHHHHGFNGLRSAYQRANL